MSSKAISFTIAAVASLALVSCESFNNAVRPPVEAIVVLPAQDGPATQYLVTSSSNNACEQGVRELRNEQWEKAITAFKQALLDDADDDNAHFGLGLSYERLGKLDLALQHYQAANRIPRQPNTMYADAVDRLRAKLGK